MNFACQNLKDKPTRRNKKTVKYQEGRALNMPTWVNFPGATSIPGMDPMMKYLRIAIEEAIILYVNA